MERIIVDGYNVIHRVSDLRPFLERSLEEARAELLLRIKSYLTHRKAEIVVVFDGDHVYAPALVGGNRLRVIFSKPPEKADAVILSLLGRAAKRGDLILVSDDQEIVAQARQVGARTLSAREFFERLTKRLRSPDLNRKFDVDLSPEELDEWIDLFSRDDGDGE